jgi:hypothetical protein
MDTMQFAAHYPPVGISPLKQKAHKENYAGFKRSGAAR